MFLGVDFNVLYPMSKQNFYKKPQNPLSQDFCEDEIETKIKIQYLYLAECHCISEKPPIKAVHYCFAIEFLGYKPEYWQGCKYYKLFSEGEGNLFVFYL